MTPHPPFDFPAAGRLPSPEPEPRPVRIALLGDFGAHALAGRRADGAALARRRPLQVEPGTLPQAMARFCALLPLRLDLGPAAGSGMGQEPQAAPVELALRGLDAFEPAHLLREVEVFAALLALRRRLGNSLGFAEAAQEIQGWEPEPPAAIPGATGPARTHGSRLPRDFTLADFARPGEHIRAPAARLPAERLVRRLLEPFLPPGRQARQDQQALLLAIDRALACALAALLRQDDLREAEALWRGVDYLLHHLPREDGVQLTLIDMSAEEFASDLARHDDPAESALHRLLVAGPADEGDGGYPLIGACYHFAATPGQAALLDRAGRLAALAGATFVTALEADAWIARPEAAGTPAPPEPRFLLRPGGVEGGRHEPLWGHPGLPALCRFARTACAALSPAPGAGFPARP